MRIGPEIVSRSGGPRAARAVRAVELAQHPRERFRPGRALEQRGVHLDVRRDSDSVDRALRQVWTRRAEPEQRARRQGVRSQASVIEVSARRPSEQPYLWALLELVHEALAGTAAARIDQDGDPRGLTHHGLAPQHRVGQEVDPLAASGLHLCDHALRVGAVVRTQVRQHPAPRRDVRPRGEHVGSDDPHGHHIGEIREPLVGRDVSPRVSAHVDDETAPGGDLGAVLLEQVLEEIALCGRERRRADQAGAVGQDRELGAE